MFSFFQLKTTNESNTLTPFNATEIFTPLVPLLNKLDTKENELLICAAKDVDSLGSKKYTIISELNQDIHAAIERYNDHDGRISDIEKNNLVNELISITQTTLQKNYEILCIPRHAYKILAKGSLELGTYIGGYALFLAGAPFFPGGSIISLTCYLMYMYGAYSLTTKAVDSIDTNMSVMPETVVILTEILSNLASIQLNFKIQEPDADLPDYYEILEIDRDATLEQIKKAYRQKALNYHPDKFLGKNLSESECKEYEKMFIIITEAYQCLSDSKMKATYDEKYAAKYGFRQRM